MIRGVEYSLTVDRKESFMTLICELNQSVVHIYGGTVGVAISGGLFQEFA